ncbi:MAG: aminodeoxychorismate synthase component I [Gammaproteobacteria bacterium]|nr:aminodeoxychorismate synthase component I [Gammaproteobacteria bacterium]
MDTFSQRRLDCYHDLLTLHRRHPQRYPYLLESVAHGPGQARYDILFAFPSHELRLTSTGMISGAEGASSGFLAAFDQLWRRERCPAPAGTALPFRGGWFVYLGYELAAEIEPGLQLPSDTFSALPIACARRCPAAIIRDHQQQVIHLVAEHEYRHCLAQLEQDLRSLPDVTPSSELTQRPLTAITLDEEPAVPFLDAVRRIKDYIRDGDVFQVNLSRAWRGEIAERITNADVYQALRRHNPAPFAALAELGSGAVISSSPERLVSVHAGVVQTRPIAGTRPRSAQLQQDARLSAELLHHPKERAEHIMLIDLERNDIGRLAQPGTVTVDELMVLESYAHVHHIVSNVRGRLRDEVTPVDVIRAMFPGGTITGCPKVRCMEIIAELEQCARGPYTGSLGYVNRDGDMDLNILIRTLVRVGTQLTLRAGAGIVADSDPERELHETRAKAKGLLLALGSDPAPPQRLPA